MSNALGRLEEGPKTSFVTGSRKKIPTMVRTETCSKSRVKPADNEAQGILFYNLDDLEKEMEHFPDLFTDDLHIFMKASRFSASFVV